jgi:hypothetical protein
LLSSQRNSIPSPTLNVLRFFALSSGGSLHVCWDTPYNRQWIHLHPESQARPPKEAVLSPSTEGLAECSDAYCLSFPRRAPLCFFAMVLSGTLSVHKFPFGDVTHGSLPDLALGG